LDNNFLSTSGALRYSLLRISPRLVGLGIRDISVPGAKFLMQPQTAAPLRKHTDGSDPAHNQACCQHNLYRRPGRFAARMKTKNQPLGAGAGED